MSIFSIFLTILFSILISTTKCSNIEAQRLDEALRVLHFNGHFEKFTSLLHKNSKLLDPVLKSQESLTILAPSDKAFDAVVPKLNTSNLDTSRMVQLLKYHALPKYYSYWGFAKVFWKPIHTLASNESRHDFVLRVYPAFFIRTGVNVARIFSKIFDKYPVVVYVVTEVLIPKEIMVVPSPPPPVFSPPPPPPPSVPSGNVRALKALEKSGHFKKFLSLIESDDHLVSKILHLKSFTMFAPTDHAFQALPAYYGPWKLLVDMDPVRTLASNKGKKNSYVMRFKLDLNATSKVSVETGVVKAKVLDIVYNKDPVAIYAVDKVLLPVDIFEASKFEL